MSRNFTPDETLIDQLLLDDTFAFEELHHRYCYSLYSYCLGKLNSREDARLVVRDVFIILWEKRHTLPIGFSISFYLYTEIRKAVVRCITEKLEINKDLSMIEKQVIPGFNNLNLQQGRLPVKKDYNKISGIDLADQKLKNKELWWNQVPSGIIINSIKQNLQKVFNYL
ncbi:MAG: hypothetical protein ABJA85_03065 [Bacteroidota bacterium]